MLFEHMMLIWSLQTSIPDEGVTGLCFPSFPPGNMDVPVVVACGILKLLFHLMQDPDMPDWVGA
jgi:hypothetical protein